MAFGDKRGNLSVTAGSTTNPTNATGSVSVSVGDVVFIAVAERAVVTAGTVTDNLGHTYTQFNAGSTSVVGVKGYYLRVTSSGTLTQISVAATASSADIAISASVHEGPVVVSPLDSNPANATDSTTPFTCPATGTLAQADELVVAWMGCGNGKTDILATSPMTLSQNVASGGGANTAAIATAFKVVSATTTTTPEFTAVSGNASGGAVEGTA